MKEAISPTISLRNLSQDELEGIKDFWNLYEVHCEEIIAKQTRIARKQKEVELIIQTGVLLKKVGEHHEFPHLQRRAIFQGEWKPFLKDLKREGVLYAQAGLNFRAWFEIVDVTRRTMVSYMTEAYGKSPKRLERAINGMNLYINILLETIGEGYFWANDGLIRQQYQVEKKLRESEERFRLVVQAAPSAMIVVDQDGDIILANARAQSLFGYKVEELAGNPVEMLVPERFRSGHVKFRGTFVDRPSGRPMGAGRDLYGLHKDGREIPIEIGLTPYENSKEVFTLALIIDITERKRAEEALRASEQLYHTTLDNMLEGVQIVDFDWRYRYVNDAVVGQGREKREHLIGHRMEDVYPGIEKTEMFAVLRQCMQERVSQKMMNEFIFPDGDKRWFELSIQPIPEGIFILSIDITERKKAETEVLELNEALERRVKFRTAELEAANKELEAFSYSVSHDLRAPLRSIDGFSLALLEDYADKLPQEGQEYLARVRAATQNMAQLIDDLLNLSRVSRSPMQRTRVDLSALALSITEELRQKELQRRVKFSIKSGLMVQADERLMKIVLVNLLNNAWKFTSKQGEAVIEFGAEDNEEGRIYYVRDNGSGFDMAYADKLFGAFQRLHSASDFPGTGVGLATVQRIINRHGGRIWAKAALHQGATFYFIV